MLVKEMVSCSECPSCGEEGIHIPSDPLSKMRCNNDNCRVRTFVDKIHERNV